MTSIKINHNQNSTFCALAWHSLTGQVNGNIGVCCMNMLLIPGQEIGNIKVSNITGLWNSEKIKELRVSMMKGASSDYCKSCYIKEKNNITSMRQKSNHYLRDNIEFYLNNTDEFGYYKGPIVKIDLRLSNLCNLACRMCGGGASTERIPLDKILGIPGLGYYTKEPYNRNLFWEDILNNNWKDIKQLKIAGGEPLINPTFYKLVGVLQKKHLSESMELIILTNLTYIPESFENILGKFLSVKIEVSVDGYEESYEYIRIGAKWEVFRNNINKILEWRRKYPNISIIFMPTIQKDNIYDFPKLYLFAKNLDIYIDIKPLIAPEFLSIKNISEEEKALINDLYQKIIKEQRFIYPEIEKDFQYILNFMDSGKSQDKYIKEYEHKSKIMDHFAKAFCNTKETNE